MKSIRRYHTRINSLGGAPPLGHFSRTPSQAFPGHFFTSHDRKPHHIRIEAVNRGTLQKPRRDGRLEGHLQSVHQSNGCARFTTRSY